MQLDRLLPIGLLDLDLGSIRLDAQRVVVGGISYHCAMLSRDAVRRLSRGVGETPSGTAELLKNEVTSNEAVVETRLECK